MKVRLLLCFLLVVTALGVLGGTGTAQATPVDELTALATYFPADTLGFAVLRTDDAYIDQLQSLIDRLVAKIPDVDPESASLRGLLNEAVGGDFNLRVRSWLGDTAAVGLISTDPQDYIAEDPFADVTPPFLAAVAITDRALIESFIAESDMADTTVTTTDAYTLYTGPDGLALLVADSVALLGDSEGTVTTAFSGPAQKLLDAPQFTAALGALPLDDYNILGYLNARALVQLSLDVAAATAEQTGDAEGMALTMLPTLQESLNATGAAAFGLTILEDRTLTIDAVNVLDADAAATLITLPGFIAQQPVSLDFAANIPADAQFVVHDNAFGPDLLAAFDSLDILGPLLQQQLEALVELDAMFGDMGGMDAMGDDLAEALDFSAINFGGGLRVLLENLFATATGLNLEADVLAWMTGDYAAYLRLLPVEGDLTFTFDAGVIWQATDAAAAGAVVEGLTAAVEAYGLGYRLEDIADGSVLVLDAPIRLLFADAIPPEVILSPELDFLIASDADVFAVGSRPAVEFALNPGESLLESPAFAYAAEALLLPGTTTVWFVNVPPLMDALPALSGLLPESDLNEATGLLSLFESATASAQSAADQTTSTVRLTLTLAE